ncbi:MAG TPA: ABC transporter substrate-binding protein [Fimbriimonadales bacterium]|nr:ABC transporter substrate-binding protein [Fimbriimonadales bacterium]
MKNVMKFLSSLALFGLIAFLLAVFAGCRREGGGYSKEDHLLIYPIPNDPTTLDPAAVEDGDTIDVLQQIYEGLVKWNTKTEVVPNLAERWEISKDGKTYTFYLKKGVKFHSGREMTAHDVKYSWDRAANPEIQSPTVDGYMMDLVGFEDVRAKKTDSISGVEVVDDYTLRVHIKEPKAYWIMYLEYPCYFIVDKESIGMERITNPAQVVGTGPFKLGEYAQSQYVELVRFDEYHGGAPKLRKVRRIIAGDAQTRRQLFEAGEVDWVQLERQDKKWVDQHPEFRSMLQIVDRPAIWYLGFSLREYPPFRDKRVRVAFAMAINKDRIIADGLDGVNQKAEGIIPPGIPGYNPEFRGYPFDVERARALLAEAGYPNGKGLPPLQLYCRADRHDAKIVSQMIQQDLLNNLGVRIDLKPMEWGALLKLRADGKLPLFHLRWHADYPDPQNFLSFMLHSKARENTLGYSNPEFDRLCDTADRMMGNPEKRLELYRRAEKIAVEDAIWVPIYFQRDLELLRPYVSGIERSLMGPLPLVNADVIRSK